MYRVFSENIETIVKSNLDFGYSTKVSQLFLKESRIYNIISGTLAIIVVSHNFRDNFMYLNFLVFYVFRLVPFVFI